ncbi:CheR family methyltransferase [Duganella violaceipulchra]|uniref:Chemotaxis protein methyltransferase WspC n=1 Tax=Duganella violaceipulchra TaxID=2849652 RepID=A0AA41L4I0_9BURK|nr:protein-glutamate O-methyltransferase CheR [Duganella violaceicalia]MBV6325318.1 protein-glutamate O-methyltransferase CheR [Duganella violaceicalia]MCP2009803.1 chemotaxis protein methyltransferase WspC [Duganella violaceicalia]
MTPAQSMLHEATGLTLSRSAVDRAIRHRMEQSPAANQDAYLDRMTPEELTALVELVVVPESWFYRDPQAFQAALEFIRARLATNANHMVRILSVPCASGEEPYTMAMVLADAGVPRASYIIDAFDISPGCVERAKSGIYGRNAFRSQDLGFRDRHFGSDGEDYRISDALRQQVRFKQGNLLEFDLGARTGHYDVIFCRNLLIYFDKPTTKAAIAKLEALLGEGGLLFAGYAEVPSFCQHGFTPLQYPQAFGLRKESARPVPAVKPAAKAAPRTARRAASPAVPAPAPKQAHRLAPVPVPAPSAPAAIDLLAEARRLADLGQLKEAENTSRDHLAQSPDSAEAYFILGLVNELTNKRQLAEDYWKRCIYLQPDHYEALCHLALLAETNNDHGAATALKARAARVYKRQQGS